MLRPCTAADAAKLCVIYNHYVRDTVVTFEETDVGETDMAQRILAVTSNLPWIVYEQDAEILGYAYATPWKSRAAYRQSVESGVYLAPALIGRGLGTELYSA